MVIRKPLCVIGNCVFLFPNNRTYEVLPSKYFVTKNFEVMALIIVDAYPDAAIF